MSYLKWLMTNKKDGVKFFCNYFSRNKIQFGEYLENNYNAFKLFFRNCEPIKH